MKTKEVIAKEFAGDLRALLAKYGEAELEIMEADTGREYIEAFIPARWDKDGETTHEQVKINLTRCATVQNL